MATRRTDALRQIADRRERLAYKVSECLAELVGRLPFRVNPAGGGRVIVEAAEVVDEAGKAPALKLTIRFFDNGTEITPEHFNPHYLVNPPMLVGDPAGDIEIVRTSLDENGNPVEVAERYREDPAAVLRLNLERLFAKVVAVR